MKERELRQHVICSHCGQKILAGGIPLFWRVTIERFGIDLKAVERQQGLTMMLGGHAVLAAVMGPDEDIAKPMMELVTVTICEDCGTSAIPVALLAEIGTKKAEAANGG